MLLSQCGPLYCCEGPDWLLSKSCPYWSRVLHCENGDYQKFCARLVQLCYCTTLISFKIEFENETHSAPTILQIRTQITDMLDWLPLCWIMKKHYILHYHPYVWSGHHCFFIRILLKVTIYNYFASQFTIYQQNYVNICTQLRKSWCNFVDKLTLINWNIKFAWNVKLIMLRVIYYLLTTFTRSAGAHFT